MFEAERAAEVAARLVDFQPLRLGHPVRKAEQGLDLDLAESGDFHPLRQGVELRQELIEEGLIGDESRVTIMLSCRPEVPAKLSQIVGEAAAQKNGLDPLGPEDGQE